jgi:hypothetical protein
MKKKIIAAKTSIYWKKKLLLEKTSIYWKKNYFWEKPAFTKILKIIARKTAFNEKN